VIILIDWNLLANLLTGFGTTATVIITLYISVISNIREKKKKKHSMISAIILMADNLKAEIDKMLKVSSDKIVSNHIEHKPAYRSFETLITMSKLSFDDNLIITFAEEIFIFLNEKYMKLDKQQANIEYEKLVNQLKKGLN